MAEFFRHYVLHNLGLKLISLGLATLQFAALLWIIANRSASAERA